MKAEKHQLDEKRTIFWTCSQRKKINWGRRANEPNNKRQKGKKQSTGLTLEPRSSKGQTSEIFFRNFLVVIRCCYILRFDIRSIPVQVVPHKTGILLIPQLHQFLPTASDSPFQSKNEELRLQVKTMCKCPAIAVKVFQEFRHFQSQAVAGRGFECLNFELQIMCLCIYVNRALNIHKIHKYYKMPLDLCKL